MNIDELRDELRRKTTNVTKKISRVKANTGAVISGTSADVRVDRSRIGKMNSRQLRAALNRADKFLDRRTQFVGLGDSTPLPRREWVEFQKLRDKQSKFFSQHYDQIKNVKVAIGDLTVAQHRELRTPSSHPQAGNPSVNVDFEVPKTKPSGVVNVRAFDRLMREAKKKSSPKYWSKQIRQYKDTLNTMDRHDPLPPGLAARIDDLSEDQFIALVNDKGFMDTRSLKYELKKTSGGDMSDTQSEISNDALGEIDKYVTWAENLKFSK